MSNVYAINKIGSLKIVSSWIVYYINSTNAELVTVYDSNNNPYDCFKYLLNNIEYYYVLDGIQNIWTNDLASIGYSLTPSVVFPTVTLPNYAWVYSGSSSSVANINPGGGFNAKDTSGNSILYDESLSYAVYFYYSSRTGSGILWDGFTTSNNIGQLKITNSSSSTVTVQRVIYATCSDSMVTVVTVYDLSNVSYNAFKYTANGTDYYYVFDGVQTDWTDNLASIGYHFTISYLTVNKSRMTVGIGESYPLYNASGTHIEYDSTKTYTAVKYYTGSGDLVGTSALGITIGYISGWSYLMLTNNTGSAIQIQRIEYTVS